MVKSIWGYYSFVHQGETVLKLLGGYESMSLLQTLGKVGKEGRVYYVTTSSHLRERLFDSIFHSLMNFTQVKGEGTKSNLYRLQGATDVLFPTKELRHLRYLLSSPYLNDLDFYGGGFSDTAVIEQLREAFYSRYPLVPISHQLPTLPREIRSGSVDVVFEMDRLAQLGEDNTEELLWEVDRVLRPGGRLLIREGAREQAEIEYYGQGLLDVDYKRGRVPKGVTHWGRWMIFYKPGGREAFPVPEIVEPTTQEHQGQIDVLVDNGIVYKPKKRVITPEEHLAKSILDAQKEAASMSVRWFKENGLLSVLMTKFGGDVEKAIEFARNQAPKENSEDQLSIDPLMIRMPKGSKSSYGLSDLSQELGVPKSVVRKAVRQLGAKTLKAGSHSQGRKDGTGLSLSYTEYIVIRDALKSQNLKVKEKHNKRDS